jgi:hypothetical protein
MVEHDYQQGPSEGRLTARRVENFVAPGEIPRPRFYSDVIYSTEEGEHVVGNRYRRGDPTRATTTTYATVTQTGRIVPTRNAAVQEAAERARRTAPPITLPTRPRHAPTPTIPRGRGRSTQPEQMAPTAGPSTAPSGITRIRNAARQLYSVGLPTPTRGRGATSRAQGVRRTHNNIQARTGRRHSHQYNENYIKLGQRSE